MLEGEPMERVDPNILRQLREAKGWTQEELAERTKLDQKPKIDKQTISRLERGTRSKTRLRTIEQLAHALKVKPGVLTGEVTAPEMKPEPTSLDLKSQFNVRISAGP